MYKPLILFACLTITLPLFAQKGSDIPGFGKVEKADLEMKSCDIDEKAEAVVLFDVGELYCDISAIANSMQLERHVRIKILKDKGKDQADIKIPYYSFHNVEYIKNLSAQTYNLDAAGNIMVIFSDGEDTRVQVGEKTLDEILQGAIDNKIPVYMVRTNYEREKGKVIPDEIWIPAIEKTGGKFYAASSEDAFLAAIADLDKVAAGTIATRQYTSQRPRFAFFAMTAAACWLAAVALKLGLPQFQKLP